jgi:hypothetical protein
MPDSHSCRCEEFMPGSGSDRLRRLAVAVCLLGVFPLAHVLAPLILRDAIPLCPFRIATGKPCPLCGLTRAFALATHGRWRDAFAMNPIWPLFAGVIVTLSGLLIVDASTSHRLAGRAVGCISAHWLWVLAGLAAFGIWRIAYWPM